MQVQSKGKDLYRKTCGIREAMPGVKASPPVTWRKSLKKALYRRKQRETGLQGEVQIKKRLLVRE